MFNDLIIQFGTLVGVAALIAAVVNICKSFGLPDGAAPKLSGSLSLSAFILLAGLKLFKPEVDVAGLDKTAADLAVGALYVLGLVVNLGLPSKFHALLSNARVPLIGKSFTNDEVDAFLS